LSPTAGSGAAAPDTAMLRASLAMAWLTGCRGWALMIGSPELVAWATWDDVGMACAMDMPRVFSNVEMHVAEALFERFGKALQSSFSRASEVKFNLERVETRMDYLAIGRLNNMAVYAKILLQGLDRGGEMFIVIPRTVLNPLRTALSQIVSGESVSTDPNWSKQLHSEIQRTEVVLKAVLEERSLTLGEVSQFHVGQVIKLNATPNTLVRLECNNQRLFWCQMGQLNGVYSLQVKESADQKREFIDGILSR